MKLIPLSQGLFAKVDDADYDFLIQFKWAAAREKGSNLFYAIAYCRKNGKRTSMKMHRLLLGLTDPKMKCDHKDRDGLNNQRENIRIATPMQNAFNRKKISKSSKYKGVKKKVVNNRVYWWAICMSNGKSVSIKATSEIDAARKYNELAIKLHGEFACLNEFT